MKSFLLIPSCGCGDTVWNYHVTWDMTTSILLERILLYFTLHTLQFVSKTIIKQLISAHCQSEMRYDILESPARTHSPTRFSHTGTLPSLPDVWPTTEESLEVYCISGTARFILCISAHFRPWPWRSQRLVCASVRPVVRRYLTWIL